MVGGKTREIDGLEVGLEQDPARKCLLAMLASHLGEIAFLCNQQTWDD